MRCQGPYEGTPSVAVCPNANTDRMQALGDAHGTPPTPTCGRLCRPSVV